MLAPAPPPSTNTARMCVAPTYDVIAGGAGTQVGQLRRKRRKQYMKERERRRQRTKKSRSTMSSEAEKKFWGTPELVEQLLSHLDLNSTRCLAEIHQMTQDLLQGGLVWKKLIQRNCPIALCAESEVRKAVEQSSYAVALKFRVFFLFLKSVKF